MKESNFYSDDDFEQLIRGKTEQYKMYPSEKVWRGVHNSLHTKRKWFIGSMALLVTGILFLAGRELILPSHNLHKTVAGTNTITDVANSGKSPAAETGAHAPLRILHPASSFSSISRHVTGG